MFFPPGLPFPSFLHFPPFNPLFVPRCIEHFYMYFVKTTSSVLTLLFVAHIRSFQKKIPICNARCLGPSFVISFSYFLRCCCLLVFSSKRFNLAFHFPSSLLLPSFKIPLHFFLMNHLAHRFLLILFIPIVSFSSQISFSKQHVAAYKLVSPKTPFSITPRSPTKRPHQGSTARR